MTGWLTKLLTGGLLVLLLAAMGLGCYNTLLSGRLKLSQQRLQEQQKTLVQQATAITALQAQNAQNRALMAEQQRREQQLRQQGEIYQRKYQDAIKNDECAGRAAPVAVLDLLRGTDTTAASANSPVAP